jgi:glyoxylase-like metal-dependent hydrolase (beta-lactamase superfamily II)
MKEILPGLYQMTLTLSGFSPGDVNTYLIKSPDGFTSIDTGWDSPPAVESMKAQLSEVGAGLADIKQIIVTHCHIDHLGMIVRFKRSHNARIFLPQRELELMKIRFTGGDNLLPMTDKFLRSHGFPAAELTPPEALLPLPDDLLSVKPDVLLLGGEEIALGSYTLRVINTPGHTPGHISLYEPREKLLFSGDVLLPTIATNAAMHVQHIVDPLRQYMNSLLVLNELDIDLVLPGHENIFSGHRKRIEELVRSHEKKASGILRAFHDGSPKTAYGVSQILAYSPVTKVNVWSRLSGWDKRFAVLQTIAHLESWRFKRKLERNVRNGIFYYYPVKPSITMENI